MLSRTPAALGLLPARHPLTRLAEYQKVRSWERFVLHRTATHARTSVLQHVPWSLIGLIVAGIVFFGFDAVAGVTFTSSTARDAVAKNEVLKKQQRDKHDWSMEQIKELERRKSGA